MTQDEEDHYRTLALNLQAAVLAYRAGLSFQTTFKKYIKDREPSDGYLVLAKALAIEALPDIYLPKDPSVQ